MIMKTYCRSDLKFVVAFALILFPCLLSAQYKDARGYSDLYDSETVTAFKEHVGFLAAASLEGRKAGS